jgi:hypothetical protein
MKPHPWSGLVERYSQFEERFEGDVPPPVTDEAIQAMLQSAQSDGLVVPDDYVDFLKTRHGASFNGLMLYGLGIGVDDSFHRLDLIVMNQYQFNRDDATILGTSDIDAYVVAAPGGPYRRLDRASWDTIDEFQTCDELLTSIFATQTEALERAG